jgi:hypothetical protein
MSTKINNLYLSAIAVVVVGAVWFMYRGSNDEEDRSEEYQTLERASKALDALTSNVQQLRLEGETKNKSDGSEPAIECVGELNADNGILEQKRANTPLRQKRLDACVLDADYMFDVIDKVNVRGSDHLRSKRRALVERLHGISSELEQLRA